MDKWKQKETEIGKVEIQTDRMCEDTPHTEMSAWLLFWWWLCGIFKSLKKNDLEEYLPCQQQ